MVGSRGEPLQPLLEIVPLQQGVVTRFKLLLRLRALSVEQNHRRDERD
jgi:hypothetical protein